jgi:NADPH:quinone reductase-like Zn-dependent oxidoreductase
LKAVQLYGHGGVEHLRHGDTDTPPLASPTDAIVNLKAAAVNHHDLTIRRGARDVNVALPHVLGSDGAGTVVEIGDQVKNLRLGDDVCLYPSRACGECEFCVTDREFMCLRTRLLGERENGTYAEYITVPARNCLPIPAGLSFEEAAAFPLAFAIAWRMLIGNADVKPGESVLILGIGGGIASAALQLALQVGAHVIATSGSDEKLDKASSHGAEYGVNYQKVDFSKEVRSLTNKRGVDVVVDNIGGECWAKSLASLAKGGRLVSCGAVRGAHPPTDLKRIFWNHLKVFGSTVGSRAEFRRVLDFMAATQTKPIIDRVFPLKETAQAQQRMEQGKQFGKIVLRMDS